MGEVLPCNPKQRVAFAYVNVDEKLAPLGVPEKVIPKPGQWYWNKLGEAPYVVCPRCGHSGRLGNHAVDANGNISPSVACAMMSCGDGVSRCDAHYYGKLEGYMFSGAKS